MPRKVYAAKTKEKKKKKPITQHIEGHVAIVFLWTDVISE